MMVAPSSRKRLLSGPTAPVASKAGTWAGSVRPIARQLCAKVQAKLINANLETALGFMETHLSKHVWFAGKHISVADFQMSFAVVAALARGADATRYPKLAAYKTRMEARPAYLRAVSKGGPVVM